MSDSDNDMFVSACDTSVSPSDNVNDTKKSELHSSNNPNDTIDSSYEGDNSVITPDVKCRKKDFSKRKCYMSPMLRRGYYGRKGLLGG